MKKNRIFKNCEEISKDVTYVIEILQGKEK